MSDPLKTKQAPTTLSIPPLFEVRAVVCIDVDAFECQVWRNKLRPDLIGLDVPLVAVNIDNVILSVNYQAKCLGVTRQTRMAELREHEKNSGLQVLRTGLRHNKWTDTFTTMKETDRLVGFINNFMLYLFDEYAPVEQGSSDELFIDLTEVMQKKHLRSPKHICVKSASALSFLSATKKDHPNPNVREQYETIFEGSDRRYSGPEFLSLESMSSEETLLLRAARFALPAFLDFLKTGMEMTCSLGVGPNRTIAKIASELNKPAGVTVMTYAGFLRLSQTLAYTNLPGLKRKTGAELKTFVRSINSDLKLESIADVRNLPAGLLDEFMRTMKKPKPRQEARNVLLRSLGQTASRIKWKSHTRFVRFSYSFRGNRTMRTQVDLEENMSLMAQDMVERLALVRERQSRFPLDILVRVQLWRPLRWRFRKFLVDDNRFDAQDMNVEPKPLERFIIEILREKGYTNVRNIKRISLSARMQVRQSFPVFYVMDCDGAQRYELAY